MRRLGLIVLLAASVLAARTGVAASAGPEAFRANEAQLKRHLGDGFWLDDAPGAPQLLAERWRLVRDAAAKAVYQRGVSPQTISVAVKALDANVEVDTARLGPDTILVAANLGESGDVFIVSPRGVTWAIEQTALIHTSIRDPIAAWSPEHARDDCRDINRHDSLGCGPVYGRITRLPDGPGGARRFFVNANYAQAAGATIGAQLSIWSWDGRTAPYPQHVTPYLLMADQDVTARSDGDRVVIREKGDFRTLLACGACFGRQMDHTLRLTPEGVEDLGAVSLEPDLDRVDALLDAVLHDRPADRLAKPQVVAALKRQFGDLRKKGRTPGAYVSLGLLTGWAPHGRGEHRSLCLQTDAGGAQLFDLDGQGAGARVVGVREIGGDCGKDARS